MRMRVQLPIAGLVMLVAVAGACGQSLFPGLPQTNNGIHVGLVFNFNITNFRTESGKVQYVWGSDSPNQPSGVYNTYYYPHDLEQLDSTGGHDLSWFLANHADWIEYECDGTTVAYDYGFGDTTDVPLDITNSEVLDYMWANHLQPALQLGYQGIAFDMVDLQNGWYATRCGHHAANGSWVQQFTGSHDDPAYRSAVITWAQDMRTRVHYYFPNATVSMNHSFDLSFPDDSYTLAQYIDILCDEVGFTWGGTDPPYLTDSDWVAVNQFLQTFLSMGTGRGLLSINQEPVAFSQITTAEVNWVLANYMLVKNNGAFVAITGPQQYGSLLIRPEYSAAIGKPAGAMMVAENAVYMRVFTNALAMVNPSSSQTCKAKLPAGTYTDLKGNRINNLTVTLPGPSGVAMLGSFDHTNPIGQWTCQFITDQADSPTVKLGWEGFNDAERRLRIVH